MKLLKKAFVLIGLINLTLGYSPLLNDPSLDPQNLQKAIKNNDESDDKDRYDTETIATEAATSNTDDLSIETTENKKSVTPNGLDLPTKDDVFVQTKDNNGIEEPGHNSVNAKQDLKIVPDSMDTNDENQEAEITESDTTDSDKDGILINESVLEEVEAIVNNVVSEGESTQEEATSKDEEHESATDVMEETLEKKDDLDRQGICKNRDVTEDSDVRLPTTILPRHYHIDLFPHFYGSNISAFFFECTTTMLLEVQTDVDIIKLHSMGSVIEDIQLYEVPFTTTTLTYPPNPNENDETVRNPEMVKRDTSDNSNNGQAQPSSESTSTHENIGDHVPNIETPNEGHETSLEHTVLVDGNHIYAAADSDKDIPDETTISDEKDTAGERVGVAKETRIPIQDCWLTPEITQTLDIKPVEMLKANSKYRLVIKSWSWMKYAPTSGLYYSQYEENNATKYMISTLMEPTDARYVFPCFDEPDFKAVFTMSIKRQSHITSVMNLPKRITLGPDEEGYFTDVFDEPTTVPMSTYLLAFAIGEMDYIEGSFRNINMKIWGRKAFLKDSQFLLENTIKFMEFFEDYFQIPFPLPKQDAVLVERMGFTGMEHWGLVTYMGRGVTYNIYDDRYIDRQEIAVLVAHEIAHQWFGNLVSPYWWDDLWLNEGFATYMMFFAVDKVYPDWNMSNRLITEYRGVHNVMKYDQSQKSHPVYIPVYHPHEINKIFDLISYAKGAAVIRMMNFILGENTFRDGLRSYLLQYSYDTATHNDLWVSLSEQAILDKCPHTDVKGIMDSWLLEKNYPVVKVTVHHSNNSICFEQMPFLETEELRSQREDVTWMIPITYTTQNGADFEQDNRHIIWLNEKSMCISDPRVTSNVWVMVNLKQYGYYRVMYDLDNYQAIVRQLTTDPTVIHPINRAQLINDAFEMAKAGMLDYGTALNTLTYLDKELDYVPWSSAIPELQEIDQLILFEPYYGSFRNVMKNKVKNAYLNSYGSSNHDQLLLYAKVAKLACQHRLAACVDDMKDAFHEWTNNKEYRLQPDLVDTVFCTASQNLDCDHIRSVLIDLFYKPDSGRLYDKFAVALGCIETPWVINSLLPEFHSLRQGADMRTRISSNAVGRLLLWTYLEANWPKFYEQHEQSGFFVLDTMIRTATKGFSTHWEVQRLKNFIQRENLGFWDETFERALERAEARQKTLEQRAFMIRAWLNENEVGDGLLPIREEVRTNEA